MTRKNIRVTKESETGLNQKFFDPSKNKTMTRGQFANEIDKGNYSSYHNMKIEINGKKMRIPRSNPDKKSNNNLG